MVSSFKLSFFLLLFSNFSKIAFVNSSYITYQQDVISVIYQVILMVAVVVLKQEKELVQVQVVVQKMNPVLVRVLSVLGMLLVSMVVLIQVQMVISLRALAMVWKVVVVKVVAMTRDEAYVLVVVLHLMVLVKAASIQVVSFVSFYFIILLSFSFSNYSTSTLLVYTSYSINMIYFHHLIYHRFYQNFHITYTNLNNHHCW